VAPLFVLGGAVMTNYVPNTFLRKMGEVLLGFGILFLGISAMSEAMTGLRDMPVVQQALLSFQNPVLGILMSLVITAVVQSSSVTVSILVVMGAQGLVDLYTYDPSNMAPAAAPKAPAGAAGSVTVTAPMPGTVVRVEVSEGDSVKAGQDLIFIEAMKMETPVKAASDGVIATINVSKGEAVETGKTLLTMN
jgi:biotin carboxyl carrier protein